MAVKTYDAGGYFLRYEVEDHKVTCDYEDTTGRIIHLNHLWFYDPETVEAIAGPERCTVEVCLWFEENSDGLSKIRVDKLLLKRFLGTDEPFRVGGLWFYHHGIPTPYVNKHTTRSTRGVTYHLLPSNEAPKPTYYIHTYCNFGELSGTSIGQTGTHQRGEVDSKWRNKINYTFKMNPDQYNFFRKVSKDITYTPMYGLELEVNTLLSTEEIYRIVTEVEPKQEPFFIFKDDASISGKFGARGNYELVTVPCSYRYLRKAWATFFKKVEDLCKAKGLEVGEVFDTSKSLTNGLHIHVSKDAFYSDHHQRKFMAVFNQWDQTTIDFLARISGRPSYTTNS